MLNTNIKHEKLQQNTQKSNEYDVVWLMEN